MLNERTVRDQLAEVRAALGKLDAERKALESIVTSLEKWLDLHSDAGGAQLPLAPTPAAPNGKTNGKTTTKPLFQTLGALPLKVAVERVLRNREGVPMETADILAKAEEMGARTESKEPEKVVEWILYDMIKKGKVPVHKLRPHRYVYGSLPPPPPPPPRPRPADIIVYTK
jgi:hypothetical protein